MNLQLIGTRKCKNTRKAERYLKERKRTFHFVDLNERALSPGELNKIAMACGKENLIDKESSFYQKKGMAYMDYDPLEELAEHSELLVTPILRAGNRAIAGFTEKQYQEFLK